MKSNNQDEELTNEINNITQKVSDKLLKEFLKLPKELQVNVVLIKSAQLLLSNILCHIATSKEELDSLVDYQGVEIKELTLNCAATGFADKFDIKRH
jgi:hypothetical protein